jgi:hypothetical protein
MCDRHTVFGESERLLRRFLKLMVAVLEGVQDESVA